MIELLDSAYWCVLQVSIVIAFGLLWARRLAFNHLDQAGNMICVTLVAATLLTLMAPLPLRQLDLRSRPAAASTTVVSTTPQQESAIQVARAGNTRSHSFSFRWTQAKSVVQKIAKQAALPHQDAWNSLKAAAVAGLLALVIGMIRFLISLRFLVKTRRRSTAVCDLDICEKVKKLARQLNCVNVPPLLQSTDLRSAAVVGPFKPAVILPGDWRNWSDNELTAVLAHEIAHIAKSDATWRLLACCVQAVHFFNPLAHILLNRMALLQELSADNAAAGIIGRRTYLKSLSQLALKREQNIGHGCPNVLPIFHGHLKRRVTMLRSTDGSHQIKAKRSQWLMALPVIGMLAVFMSVLSLRVAASAESEQTGRLNGGPTKILQSDQEVSVSFSTNGFHREPISTSVIGSSDTGFIAVRVKETLDHPVIKPFAPLLNSKMLFENLSFADIDLSAIDWNQLEIFASAAELELDPAEGNDKDVRGKFLMDQYLVQLTDAVELKQWTAKLFPTAKLSESENLVTATITTKDAAPLIVNVQQHAARTIKLGCTTTVREKVSERASDNKLSSVNELASSTASHQRRAWKAMSGGLASVVLSDIDLACLFASALEGQVPSDAGHGLTDVFAGHCSSVAFGLDLNPDGNLLIQARLTHTSTSNAKAMLEKIEILRKMMISQAQNTLLQDGDPIDLSQAELFIDWFKQASFDTQAYDNSSCDLIIKSEFPLVAFMQLL
jgi:beta-lactamase regulating signal transducer with metallopeptidase domain